MESSIFTPDLGKLAKLETLDATRLFRDLLWCDSARLGLRNIFVSEETSTSDGGIDAKAELPIDEKNGVKGSFHFQIKSGTTFKPWQPAAVVKELFGALNAKRQKASLGKAVRHCMDTGGVYVVVVLGHDLLPTQHTEAIKLLTDAFKACGYRAPQVEVWGVSQLAQKMQLHPSLCLDFNGLADVRLQTVDSWAANSDMAPMLAVGAAQKTFMSDLVGLLRSEELRHVRVVGEPGVGKTRMVLEALRSDRSLSTRTIYVPRSSGFLNSHLLFELLKPDREYWTVLVVDECEQSDRSQIFRLLKARPRVKLLTIDHGEEKSDDDAMKTLPYPPLGDTAIRTILAAYIGKAEVGRWVEWCEGSARVAHAVGDNLKRNPDDVLASPATVPIWERFILGYKESGTASSDRLLAVARHIALFRRFGFRKPVEAEGKFIAALAAKADPKITPARFNQDVSMFLDRRVLQGGHTLRLVPKALHVHLWREWWQFHGVDVDLAEMLDSLPPAFHRWFVDMLDYANGSPDAREAIEAALAKPDGPFAKKSFIRSDTGGRFLATLAGSSPAATLALLERTVGRWRPERFNDWRYGRDDVCRAISTLGFWQDHFHSAAMLLARVAKHAKNGASSDARRRLEEMFHLGGGRTQAPPDDRLAFITELLRSDSSWTRDLGLDLLAATLKNVGAWNGDKLTRGMLPSVSNWRAKSDGELFAAWRAGVALLRDSERPHDAAWQCRISGLLIDLAVGWIRMEALVDDCLEILEAIPSMPHHNAGKLASNLVSHLKYRSKKASVSTIARLHALLDSLGQGPFMKRFARYVEFETSDEDWASIGEKIIDVTLPEKRVSDLVDEFLVDEKLRDAHRAEVFASNGRRISIFARRLALKATPDQRQEFFDQCVEVGGKAGPRFLSSLLLATKAIDATEWESFAMRLLAGKRPAVWRVDAVMSSGFSAPVVEALERFAREFDEGLHVFKQLGYSFAQQQLSAGEIERILCALMRNPSNAASVVAVEIAAYWFGGEKKCVLPERLHFEVLFNKRMLRTKDWDTMESHYWGELAKSFRRNYPSRDLDIVRKGLGFKKAIGRIDTMTSLFELVSEVCAAHPKQAWPVVSKALDDEGSSDGVSYWLGGDGELGARPTNSDGVSPPIAAFNPADVFAWIDMDAKKRAPIVADCLPRTFDGRAGELTLGFASRYAAKDQVAGRLTSRFFMGSRSGPATEWLSAQREEALAAASKTDSEAVRKWIRNYVASLSSEIERHRISEERRM
jgi:hypothetical protein